MLCIEKEIMLTNKRTAIEIFFIKGTIVSNLLNATKNQQKFI